ncbi:hypothetical protein Tco_0560995 [Tanacetum coccineum]
MWIMASRNKRLIWICLKIERSRSSSSSFFCFFNLDGKGRLGDLEGPSFSVALSVWLVDVDCGGVALLLKWKKRSWVATCHPIDRLDIGHILQFDSTLLLWSWKRVQALLMGSSSPCLNQRIKSLRDEVLGGVGSLTLLLLEFDASSSKRFLLAIARDSFYCRRQAALLSL